MGFAHIGMKLREAEFDLLLGECKSPTYNLASLQTEIMQVAASVNVASYSLDPHHAVVLIMGERALFASGYGAVLTLGYEMVLA